MSQAAEIRGPEEWGEEELFAGCLLEALKDRDLVKSLFAEIEYVGVCDCCGVAVIETQNFEIVAAFAKGTALHSQVESLFEKPFEVSLP